MMQPLDPAKMDAYNFSISCFIAAIVCDGIFASLSTIFFANLIAFSRFPVSPYNFANS